MSKDRFLDEFPGDPGDIPHIQSKPGSRPPTKPSREHWFASLWSLLTRTGLAETAFRMGTHLLTFAAVLAALWAMRAFYRYVQSSDNAPRSAVFAAPLPQADPTQTPPELPVLELLPAIEADGIPRFANLHTSIPTRPRGEVITYTVVKGDTLFGIAEQFGLKPQTLLWGNYYTLADDPHRLRIGQILNILPVNGVYHKWTEGEGLNGVSSYYGVTPEDIINWPGNQLDAATIGDWSSPNIEPGAMLVVPGGTRDFVSWSVPPNLTRQNPAVAKVMGPGFCGSIVEGAIGTGAFVWPATNHWLSGYPYSPEMNHRGIDIAGGLGNAIYAADTGVVVYAGWNDWGYGNVVVLDHGNGWQTLYAHMSTYNVGCGQSVYGGDVIGAFGSTGNSTGPHLHFEMIYQGVKVNPLDFLP